MKFKHILDGYKPVCVHGGKLFIVRHNALYRYDIKNKQEELLLYIPIRNKWKYYLSKVRVLERILRTQPRAAILKGEFLYLSYKSVLYTINLEKKEIEDIHYYSHPENNPLPSDLAYIKGINGFHDQMVYGEYWMNDTGEPISIYSHSDKWTDVYTFPRNTVRHIHAIVPDKYRNCVWILTGDKDGESGFWKATDDFKKVEKVVIGSQQFRSCCAHVYSTGILYATDSPDEQNYLYFLKIDGDKYQIKPIMKLNGSCIYSKQTSNKSFFSTVVEFNNNIHPNFLTWISYERGTAIHSWFSDIICVDGKDIEIISEKFKKDIWPMRLCRYSAIEFFYDEVYDETYIYFMAIKQFDNKIYRLDK